MNSKDKEYENRTLYLLGRLEQRLADMAWRRQQTKRFRAKASAQLHKALKRHVEA